MKGSNAMESIARLLARHAPIIGWSMLVGVLGLLLVRHWPLGPRFAVDFARFDAWSGYLLDVDFDYRAFYQRIGRPERLYTVPLTLMALLKVWFGAIWQDVYFWLNLVWASLTILATCAAARLLKVSWLAIAAVLPLVLLSADFMFWPHYLLTDTLFAFLLMALVWWLVFMLTRVHASALQRAWQSAVAIMLLGLVALGRPTSLPYVLAIAGFAAVLALRLDRLRPWQLLLSLAMGVGVVALIYGVLIAIYVETDWMGRSRELSFIARFAGNGMIVWDRPETAITHAGGWLGYAQVFLVRVATFWSPYASSFSTVHLLANGAITLVFLAAVLGWVCSGRLLERVAGRAVLLILLIAVAASCFHGLLFIDYDWRYRFPVVAPMLLLSMLLLDRWGRRLVPGHLSVDRT
jgi:hypothetical protein